MTSASRLGGLRSTRSRRGRNNGAGRPLVAAAALALAAALAPASAQRWPGSTMRVVAPFGCRVDAGRRRAASRRAAREERRAVVLRRRRAGRRRDDRDRDRGTGDTRRRDDRRVDRGPLVNDTVSYRSMPYDPFRDLAPITLAVNRPCLFVAGKALPAGAPAALLAELGREPGKYDDASLGNGTVSHLVMVLIPDRTRANLVQVRYPGSGQAVGALIAGEASLACLPPSAVVPQAKAGNLLVIGIAAARRSLLFPDIPTLAELGLPGVEANAWIGFVAPRRTPTAVVARMQAEIAKALHDPDVAKTLQSLSMEPVGGTPDAFAAHLREELARWKPIIEANHVALD